MNNSVIIDDKKINLLMDHELGERRNPDLVFTHLEMEYKSQHSGSKSLSHPNTVHYVHSALNKMKISSYHM